MDLFEGFQEEGFGTSLGIAPIRRGRGFPPECPTGNPVYHPRTKFQTARISRGDSVYTRGPYTRTNYCAPYSGIVAEQLKRKKKSTSTSVSKRSKPMAKKKRKKKKKSPKSKGLSLSLVPPAIGQVNPVKAVKRLASKQTAKSVAAGGIGWLGGKLLGTFLAGRMAGATGAEGAPRFKPETVYFVKNVVGGLVGAIVATIAGNVIFKSTAVGDAGAAGNLLFVVEGIAGKKIGEFMGFAGIEGYVDGLGQIHIPEEIEIAGLSQVHLPEGVKVAGQLGMGQDDASLVMTEEELEEADLGQGSYARGAKDTMW